MKKTLCMCLALCMLMLCGCGATTPATQPTTNPAANPTTEPTTEPTTKPTTEPITYIVQEGPTGIDFGSDVLALEGTWKLSQVYVDGEMKTPVEDAITFTVTLQEDPSELVNMSAYIHNHVYNLTGHLTFGIAEIKDKLAADGVEEYKGTTGWENFSQGSAVPDGGWYQQPGPATMRFKNLNDYGLYLDQIAGASDVDTTNKTLIIAMNGSGQLLLGYSEEHLERPGTEGEWVYCLIFDKA